MLKKIQSLLHFLIHLFVERTRKLFHRLFEGSVLHKCFSSNSERHDTNSIEMVGIPYVALLTLCKKEEASSSYCRQTEATLRVLRKISNITFNTQNPSEKFQRYFYGR